MRHIQILRLILLDMILKLMNYDSYSINTAILIAFFSNDPVQPTLRTSLFQHGSALWQFCRASDS